jgi:hypothetical protein
MARTFSPEELREELARLTVAASVRSGHGAVTLGEARRIVAALIGSDLAPEWRAITAGRDDARRLVRIIRQMEVER